MLEIFVLLTLLFIATVIPITLGHIFSKWTQMIDVPTVVKWVMGIVVIVCIAAVVVLLGMLWTVANDISNNIRSLL